MEIGKLQRYFNRDSIGPPYSRMHTSLCPLVTNTKEWEDIKQDEPPLQPILEVELFDIWGMDFMGPFPSYFSNL